MITILFLLLPQGIECIALNPSRLNATILKLPMSLIQDTYRMNSLSMKIFIGSLFALLLATGCKKEKAYMNNGEIIGWDAKMCPCCGGLEITIDGVANPVANTYFLINQMPSYFVVDSSAKFPIEVRIDWKLDSNYCSATRIDITRIARR